MSKPWVDTKSKLAYLKRLAVVYFDELRLKIVTELYMQEMSATQFYDRFGGGSVSRVSRHMSTLWDHEWLRYIRTESGGERRGGHEHFFRATKLAVFDTETWSLVPYSVRVAFSWRTFKQLAERVRDALIAGTLDARADSHLSWTPLLLDQLGWDRIVAAVDKLFGNLLEEQEDAKLRVFHSGEKPFLAIAGLTVFESPSRAAGAIHTSPPCLEPGEESPVPFTRRLAKVFADELSLRILTEANLRPVSAPLLAREFGDVSAEKIRRRLKSLAALGWLNKVEEKTGGSRRGASEHFYRATGPAIFDNESWIDVPERDKAAFSWRTFEQLAEEVKKSVAAELFDARPDNHLTWTLLRLDQQGWENVIGAIEELFEFIFEEQKQAKERMKKSGEEPITTTVALLAFEATEDTTKAP